MKKFNYIFILIVSIISILMMIFGNYKNDIAHYLITISIIPIMLLPYIIKKIFKIEINESVITLFLVFIFFAQFLGVILGFYETVYIYDKLMHTLSGVMTSFLALIILIKSKNYNPKSIWFNVLFIIAITCMVAVCWEIFEYVSDGLFKRDAQRVLTSGVNDTMRDMIVALLGSCMFSLCYVYEVKIKKNLLINNFIKKIKNHS